MTLKTSLTSIEDFKYPKISAVICSLNGHKRISRAIKSVLTQDFHNLELIVVDDGSQPPLREAVKVFNDKRIKYLRLESNIGLHAARTFALEQSTGEYVALLDDDDWWFREKLSRQLQLIDGVSEVGMVCSGAIDIYPDGTKMCRIPSSDKISYAQEIIEECTIASSILFRRSVYKEVGGFDPTLHRCGDWDCWIRLAKSYQIRSIKSPLVVTTMRHGSLQRSGDIKAFAEDRLRVVNKNSQEIHKLGLWHKTLSRHLHSIGMRFLRANEFISARQYLSRALRHRIYVDTLLALIFALFRFHGNVRFRKIVRAIKNLNRIVMVKNVKNF
jgi:glycosyltransferase involved in cell wall biosynthesis